MRATLKDEKGIKALLQSLESRTLPNEVISSLVKQNSIELSITKEEVLEKLKEKPLFVLTGQQVGLYGGPLLTLYKAITAIKAARLLSERLKKNVAPIFWLQSEDHDLAEISEATVAASGGELIRIIVDPERAKNNRRSVGEIQLSSDISSANDRLKSALSSYSSSDRVLGIIESQYVSGRSWSDSFLGLFKELFKDTPLLFFDLNRDALKNSSTVKEVFKRSISEMERIETCLSHCTEVQDVRQGVSLKTGSPLAFVSDENGNRFRLTRSAQGNFSSGNQAKLEFSKEELIALVDSEPERFSSSALLRPILQDSIFPTLAYVGGDAELQYHKQLDSLYPEFDLTPPLLLSREKFRLLSKKTKQLVDEIGLPLDDFLESNQRVSEKLRESGRQFGIDTEAYLKKARSEIESLSAQFEPLVKEIDVTLEEPLRKTTANAINGYTQFLSRLSKASIQKDSVTLNRIDRVRSQVFPFGKEQERELSLISALARTGVELIEQINGLNAEFDGSIRELVIDEY